jgi:hypothetical protein
LNNKLENFLRPSTVAVWDASDSPWRVIAKSSKALAESLAKALDGCENSRKQKLITALEYYQPNYSDSSAPLNGIAGIEEGQCCVALDQYLVFSMFELCAYFMTHKTVFPNEVNHR